MNYQTLPGVKQQDIASGLKRKPMHVTFYP